MTSERSYLIDKAIETYQEYEMDRLPPNLQRNSLDYYYLSVYPGLKKMHEFEDGGEPKLPESVHNAYVHIPYCTGVCDFCSYFLTTVSATDHSPISDYLEVVKEEVIQKTHETNLDLSYIYFGGGTPSLIPNPALESFFDFLNENNVLSSTLQGTLELHPEFFQDQNRAQDFITILKANGVGRVSVGFESSNEEILNDNNRRHSSSFLNEAINFLKRNEMLVNLDLMYGLPGMKLDQWERTLHEATAAKPDSITPYFLFVDPGTVTYSEVKRGKIVLPSHEEIQIQHLMAQFFLEEQGYYELPSDFFGKTIEDPKSFTQDSLPSNSVSVPLGAGSYGHYDKTQFFNQFNIKKYKERIQTSESPIWRGYRFEGIAAIHRDMMFSFKNSPHINRALFVERYGVDPVEHFPDQFATLTHLGLVKIDDVDQRITLTRKGRLCVEEIACLFTMPDLKDNIAANASSSERKKLNKHNFVPLYLVKKPE